MSVTSITPSEKRIFDGCEGVQFAEVLEKTGITYRQLDYWSRTGRVKRHYHLHGKIVTDGGSGSTACYLPDQVRLIGRVAALLRRNFELDHAFILATNLQAAQAALAELTYIEADLVEEEERGDALSVS